MRSGNLSSFAKKVYLAVAKIPFGEVRSYKWVARQAGRPGACRAVGQILKRNPCPLIMPCHRVVKSDSKPGGYIFGEKNKKELLGLERALNLCLKAEKRDIIKN